MPCQKHSSPGPGQKALSVKCVEKLSILCKPCSDLLRSLVILFYVPGILRGHWKSSFNSMTSSDERVRGLGDELWEGEDVSWQSWLPKQRYFFTYLTGVVSFCQDLSGTSNILSRALLILLLFLVQPWKQIGHKLSKSLQLPCGNAMQKRVEEMNRKNKVKKCEKNKIV